MMLGGQLRLVLSHGANDVTCTDSTLAGDLTTKAGSGDDSVDHSGTTVGGQQKINLDGGLNTMVAP